MGGLKHMSVLCNNCLPSGYPSILKLATWEVTCINAPLGAVSSSQRKATMACIAKLGERWGGIYRVPPRSQSIGGKQELCIRNRLKKKKKNQNGQTVTFSPAWMQWDAFGAFQLEAREAKLMEDFLDLLVRHRWIKTSHLHLLQHSQFIHAKMLFQRH